ncbi:BolA/IbaG family iron-sulfur metabolism protein [Pseudenhygromyxa sp. WMMC2535]|nr:BolA/IbaG family iron-sulfur metabolism protein [Pseudenhygromyxa sp. WMMC2535]NVB36891.1 BolA/IbaG family iron-sulfur metabolism protein [Pseudenhygromyxa sp. WMMC2535]
MSAEAIAKQLHDAVVAKLPDAKVEVEIGSPGHFTLTVTSGAFAGKTPVAKQRLVYSSISHLMAGDAAPVHAIDRLSTLLPEA